MKTASHGASPESLDKELVFTFFWKFSVFECALKREGFLIDTKAAKPNWDTFGNKIKGRFKNVRLEGFQDALEALHKYMPHRQIVTNEKSLGWENIERNNNESDEQFTIRLLKAVRNNLFHGGKYPDGPIEEVARDKEILQAALKVLEGCYEVHPSLAGWSNPET